VRPLDGLNKEWHQSHPMPPKVTREQHIKWHSAHVVACGCRAVPQSIEADVEKLSKLRRKGT